MSDPLLPISFSLFFSGGGLKAQGKYCFFRFYLQIKLIVLITKETASSRVILIQKEILVQTPKKQCVRIMQIIHSNQRHWRYLLLLLRIIKKIKFVKNE